MPKVLLFFTPFNTDSNSSIQSLGKVSERHALTGGMGPHRVSTYGGYKAIMSPSCKPKKILVNIKTFVNPKKKKKKQPKKI